MKRHFRFFRIFGALFFLLALPSADAVEYQASSLRDPFERTGGHEGKPQAEWTDLTLEGLIWQSEQPQAIVNGEVVQVGSQVQDAEVVSIDQEGVKLRRRGSEFYLRIKKGI